MQDEVQVNDYVGPSDNFDVFKMTVQPGRIHVKQTTTSAIPHLLQLIYDVNGNGSVDQGDVLASGTTDLAYNVPDLSGGGLSLVFLRVSINGSGEFQSDGNYTLNVAGRNVADVNDTIGQSVQLGSGGSGTATISNKPF